MAFGSLAFKPSVGTTLLLGALLLVFLRLGAWQLDRAEEKRERQQRFDSAPAVSALPVPDAAAPYLRVSITLALDPRRHFLVDNRVFEGRAGVHVLTPGHLLDGRTILVNRGWLPLPRDRRELPEFDTPREPIAVAGILDEAGSDVPRIGGADELQPDRWPQLVTYPEIDALAEALGTPLYPFVLLLSGDSPAGFADRDWQPVVATAAKHEARALQWFTFAAAAVLVWIWLGARRTRGTSP